MSKMEIPDESEQKTTSDDVWFGVFVTTSFRCKTAGCGSYRAVRSDPGSAPLVELLNREEETRRL